MNEITVGVMVGVEPGLPPAPEEPDRKRHDYDADEHLGAALDGERKTGSEENDRQSNREEGARMSASPEETKERRPPSRTSWVSGHQRGDGYEVVRVARMTKAEQESHAENDHQPVSFAQRNDEIVEPEHAAS